MCEIITPTLKWVQLFSRKCLKISKFILSKSSPLINRLPSKVAIYLMFPNGVINCEEAQNDASLKHFFQKLLKNNYGNKINSKKRS